MRTNDECSTDDSSSLYKVTINKGSTNVSIQTDPLPEELSAREHLNFALSKEREKSQEASSNTEILCTENDESSNERTVLMHREEDDYKEFPSPSADFFDFYVCYICYDERKIKCRPCCGHPVCFKCISEYIKLKVSCGQTSMQCIGCGNPITDFEIRRILDQRDLERYERFIIESRLLFNQRTCPRCRYVYEFDKLLARRLKGGGTLTQSEAKIRCPMCNLEWCFPCHAPWHENLKCKQYQDEDSQFHTWTHTKNRVGHPNAQKCPRCKIYVQRSEGCLHMTCSKCKMEFCYLCGQPYKPSIVKCLLLGDHMSKYSPMGCKQLLLPNHPTLRNIIRIFAFVAKRLLLIPLLIIMLIALLFAVIPLILFAAVPVIASLKIYQHCVKAKSIENAKLCKSTQTEDPSPESSSSGEEKSNAEDYESHFSLNISSEVRDDLEV